jgi:hypothetical protein
MEDTMNPANWPSIGACAALLAAVLSCSGSAAAQSDQAIPEAALREPWDRHLAVLQTLSATIAAADAGTRTRTAVALEALELALGLYEERVDRVIDRIVADPQFAYVATEISQALSMRLADIHGRFDILYSTLGVRERDDVLAAQAALDKLRIVLRDEVHFERDVGRALGSGSRQQIVELATRWWYGEERAIAVKKAVAALRQALPVAGAEGRSP